jgi:NAD(P)-dependent dehydrogenase (short-subunit alcohol dehydrogenase family)
MNKIIILSGADKGLGLDIYNTLKNYRIATISRHNKEFENDVRFSFRGDITNKIDVSKFFKKVFIKWGEIDILINNAGLLGEFKKIPLYEESEINELLAVNIKGTFLMTQEALKVIKYPQGGLIVNVGSTRSITGAKDKSLYCMTKFALRGLTQCINEEYNSQNIYSTIICPGSFKTVDTKEIAKIVKMLIELPRESLIPEIIIGGKL